MAHGSDVKGDGPHIHLYSLVLEPLREGLNKGWDGVGGEGCMVCSGPSGTQASSLSPCPSVYLDAVPYALLGVPFAILSLTSGFWKLFLPS